MAFGILLAGIWLIVSHLLPLLGIHFPQEATVYSVIELISGVLVLFTASNSRMRSAGWLALGAWLLFGGLFSLVPALNFSGLYIVKLVLTLAAAVLLLVSGPNWIRKQWGTRLTAVWLLIVAATMLSLSFTGLHIVVAVLGIAAGVFLVIRK